MFDAKKYIDYLDEWLRNELDKRSADGFVVGVSGGIDSAVVVKLLARQFREETIGLILPCRSTEEDIIDARLVCEDADIIHQVIDISEDRELMLQHVAPYIDDLPIEKTRVIDGNIRARLRMVTLFGVAQAKNYLVVGTDNAAEWITGYFTKFGDGAADITPLIKLQKSEVYELARVLGVPRTIVERVPSAGLWENQTDESEIGTTYEMIEKFNRGETIPEKDLAIIQFWKNRSDHKRTLPYAPKAPKEQ